VSKGYCKLTQKAGRFVKCHILPEALTRPERRGANLVQYGQGRRPIKRWTSWYDRQLVIEEGEAVLSRYDNWAIKALHRHKMVWSSWGSAQSLEVADFKSFGSTPWGVRSITDCDTRRLRLFFLSVLWRAAVTSLEEFAEVQMPAAELEQLRVMVLDGNPEPLSFYPISLTQLSTRGIVHNLPTLAQTKEIPSPDGQDNVPIFRIYFDGLIAHFQRPGKLDAIVGELGPLMVGNEKRMTFSTVTFENSFERENLLWNAIEAHRDWPVPMERLVDLDRILGSEQPER
jgi:hypothetical protein